ncbi:hypothetical protein FMM08_07860 [Quadrisphaera setariae]|uniref:Uncharacterized protein n=1 Tax=Quadrisphaera setariae TaxID=2593304 RepID=A0A5C8ZHG9_9ACTN|nr:hypothetical protein FMM08_07860 [Quadrisphaera setariae]
MGLPAPAGAQRGLERLNPPLPPRPDASRLLGRLLSPSGPAGGRPRRRGARSPHLVLLSGLRGCRDRAAARPVRPGQR